MAMREEGDKNHTLLFPFLPNSETSKSTFAPLWGSEVLKQSSEKKKAGFTSHHLNDFLNLHDLSGGAGWAQMRETPPPTFSSFLSLIYSLFLKAVWMTWYLPSGTYSTHTYIYIVCVFYHSPPQSRCSAVAMETSRWVCSLWSRHFSTAWWYSVSLLIRAGVCTVKCWFRAPSYL